jgi:plastocyanin
MNRDGFSPAVTTIRAGQVVEWLNMDLAMHGVAHEAPVAADGRMPNRS